MSAADCGYCGATAGRCRRRCPLRRCSTCGGIGYVVDYEQPVDTSDAGNTYWTRPCPSRCWRSLLARIRVAWWLHRLTLPH